MTSSTSDDRPMKSGRAAKGDDEADPFTQIEIPHEEKPPHAYDDVI